MSLNKTLGEVNVIYPLFYFGSSSDSVTLAIRVYFHLLYFALEFIV